MPEPTKDELAGAITLLEEAGPEYRTLLDGRPASGFLKLSEAAALVGWSEHTARTYADRGLLRGAILYPHGWSIPWSGLVCFVADQYRQTLERGKRA